MSVDPISARAPEPPAVRAGETLARPVAGKAAPNAPVVSRDEAVFSDMARKLAAAMAANEAAHRLHLSPVELREMITPPQPGPLEQAHAARVRQSRLAGESATAVQADGPAVAYVEAERTTDGTRRSEVHHGD